MRYLKQNTDQYVTVGPFIDKTDGITVKDDLTVTNIAYVLSISTHSGASTHASGTCSATAANDYGMAGIGHGGMYDLKIADTDINFVGSCTLTLTYSTAYLPVFMEFMVVPANVWDSLMGTDLLDVNASQVGGTTQTGRDIGASVLLSSGTGTGQVSLSSGAISTVTTVTNQLTAAAIATGVWQDATAGDFTTASSIGKALYISNVAPGASGGHMISGTNAGTTVLGALTVTGACTHGSTVLGNTTMGTLTQTGAASLGVGSTVTFATFAITGAMSVGTTTTYTGAVSFGSTETHTGATTYTGAITATNGSNDIFGINVAKINSQAATASGGVTFPATIASTTNITAASGITLSATQAAYAPAKAGDAMTLTAAYDAAKTAGTGTSTLTTSDIDARLTAFPVQKSNVAVTAPADMALQSTLAATVWNALLTGMTTAGSLGKKLADWVVGTITANQSVNVNQINGKAVTAANPVAFGSIVGNETHAIVVDANGYITFNNTLAAAPTVDAIANAVWDETLGDHVGTGSTGKKLTDTNTTTPPTAAAITTTILTDLTSSTDFNTASSFGKLIKDNLDAKVSEVGGGTAPNVDQIADAVWNEVLTPHTTPASASEFLTNAGGAADPLLKQVPGSYAAGTAGEALGNIPSVKAKTDLITDGGSVSVLPASVYNDDVTILIGQDHLISNGLDLAITGPSWWPILTGGSVVYELRAGNTVYKQFTGTIVAAKQTTCELTKAVTALLNPGNYAFRVLGTESVANGGETTVLLEGRAIVQY